MIHNKKELENLLDGPATYRFSDFMKGEVAHLLPSEAKKFILKLAIRRMKAYKKHNKFYSRNIFSFEFVNFYQSWANRETIDEIYREAQEEVYLIENIMNL